MPHPPSSIEGIGRAAIRCAIELAPRMMAAKPIKYPTVQGVRGVKVDGDEFRGHPTPVQPSKVRVWPLYPFLLEQTDCRPQCLSPESEMPSNLDGQIFRDAYA